MEREIRSAAKAPIAMAILVGIMIALASATVGADKAWAGGGGSIDYLDGHKTVCIAYLGKADLGLRAYGDSKPITGVKSSNKKIATVKSYTSSSWSGFTLTIKKAGTTTLAYKHKGKTHKVKYVVKNYASPFSSIKVAGKEYKSAFKRTQLSADGAGRLNAATNTASFAGKLVIKPAKGWKVSSVTYYNGGKAKTFKGKSTLSVNKTAALWIDMKNTKTGQVDSFVFNAMGNNYKYFKNQLHAA